jgi:hypothetical protein
LDALINNPDLYARDAPASFGDFVHMVGNDIDPKLVAEKYDDYRFGYESRIVQIFFNARKSHAWYVN